MRSRRLSHLAGIAALAAMLFAQAAFALASCDVYRAQSHAAMVAAQDADGAPCHEADENPNLCHAHCHSGEQSLDKHQVKVPAPLLYPVLLIRSSQGFHPPLRVAARAPCPAAAPPPRILFQSLLI